MGNLTGRTALVTGGGRDVGAEICRVLAAAGAKVAINYNSSKAEAEKVAAEITKAGGTAATYLADVADLEQVRRMIAQVKADFGGLGILVNNAGFVIRKRFAETQPEDWHKQIICSAYTARSIAAMRPVLCRSRRQWPDHFDHRQLVAGRQIRAGDCGGGTRRDGRIDEIPGAGDGAFRGDV